MGAFFKFLATHVWPSIMLAIGSFLTIAAPVAGAFKVITLPLPWPAFMAMGAAIFMLAVVFLIFAAHNSAPLTSSAAGEITPPPVGVDNQDLPLGSQSMPLPMGGGTVVAGHTIPPRPDHLVLPSEIPKQSANDEAARDKLGLFAGEVFAPATKACNELKWFLRDYFQLKIERYGKASALKAAVGFGIDHNIRRGPLGGGPLLSPVQWLYQSETLERLTKNQALDIFCGHYEDYRQDVQICVDLVIATKPFYGTKYDDLLTLYETWRVANKELIEGIEVFAKDIYLRNRLSYLSTERKPPEFPDLGGLKATKDHFE